MLPDTAIAYILSLVLMLGEASDGLVYKQRVVAEDEYETLGRSIKALALPFPVLRQFTSNEAAAYRETSILSSRLARPFGGRTFESE